MSTMPALPTYAEVENALKETTAKYDAAQVHGLMCGLICATSGKEDRRWQKLLYGKEKYPKSQEVLLILYETSYHQMSEFSFEFGLLLPSERDNINHRAETLGLWCQGFLTGLEQGGFSIQNRDQNEITEAINDLIEISQVTYGDINDNEEDETAYFELVEYVRLAALMIFHEIKSNNTPTSFGKKDSLH